MVNRQSKAGSRREDILFWQRVVEAHFASELTIKQFCENEGLATWRFYYWRNKLRGSVKSPSAGQEILPLPASRFTQVAEMSSSPEELRIEFPEGIFLHIPGDHDPVLLPRVIDLLRERLC